MTEIPPPRWKVIERGRRLEVIDTQAENNRRLTPVDRRSAPPLSLPLALPRQVRFDGGAELTTHRLYDDKAPRTILLDPGSAALLKRVQIGAAILAMIAIVAVVFWPWLLIALVPLFQANVRKPARERITRWLDRVESEGGA